VTHQLDDYINRDEAATLAGCSPDTIKRDEKAHNLQTRTAPGGNKLVRVGDLVDIGRIPTSALTAGLSAADASALKTARDEIGRHAVRCAKLDGQLEEAKANVADLRGQLKAKDHQINELLATISFLVATGPRSAA